MAIVTGLPAFKGLAVAQDGIRMRPGYYTAAAPTTGLTKGDFFIGFLGSVPRFGVCSSTGSQAVKYVRTRSKTFGSTTA
jgi:hypothetical protein